MNRSVFPTLLLSLLVAGQTQASSIVVLKSSGEEISPSMVAVGSDEMQSVTVEPPAPGQSPVAISPSMVVLGEPAVSNTATAAVERKPRHPQDTLVIRGSIFGSASPPVELAPSASNASVRPNAEPAVEAPRHAPLRTPR